MRLDDPEAVRAEYASEKRFAVRAALWERTEGPDAKGVALAALAEVAPRRVLEVGCGRGDFAERVARELRAEVVAADLSPRMVELTRARGIECRIADVQELPFDDGEFDAAAANWMLYHAADLDRSLSELSRVLRPGGRLVAATNSERNLDELWSLFGDKAKRKHPFSAENGAARLRRAFAHVEERPVAGGRVQLSREEARDYVAASVVRSVLADDLPEEGWPLVTHRRVAVFVAEKAA